MSQVHLDSKQIKRGLVLLIVFVLLRAGLTYLTEANGEMQTMWQRIVFLVGSFLLLSVGLTYFGFTRWVGVDISLWWSFNKKRLWGDIGWGVLGFIAGFIVNMAFALLALQIGLIPQEAVVSQPSQSPLVDWVLSVFFGFAIAAFQEETIFRGFLMEVLQKRFSVVWSVILQALVFSLAHLGYIPLEIWVFFLLAFIFGLLFGALRVKRGSLMSPWIAHGLIG